MARPRLLPLLLLVAAVLAVAGCSQGSEDRPDQNATLVLDFQPNAVHAGIYLALERDYDGAEGVTLRVQAPSSSTDSVKLLLSGRAQFAILDIHDLALAREKGRDIVGVMAVVQVPLAAVMAQPQIRRPRDLEGRKAGVTGLPSDDAVLSSIVRGDGGDPSKVRKVTIGFQAVPALLAHRVDAATAFWNAEGVALSAKRPGIRQFKVDDYGAPPYPELVLCVSRETLQDDRSLVAATVRALRRGYEETINDPESAVSALVDAAHVDRDETARELDAVSPAFTEGAAQYGELDPAALRAWARWEARFGITKRPPDVAQAFAPGF
jgi:ABC-type nitrate/sulfonate/bicarbonate transport system substrate-binding protein